MDSFKTPPANTPPASAIDDDTPQADEPRPRRPARPRPRRLKRKAYTTRDVARWFRTSLEEIQTWVKESARYDAERQCWRVVLDQRVGTRRRRTDRWRFHMFVQADRRGTSRPPTAARRAKAKARR